MDLVQILAAILSSPSIAAFGPTGVVVIAMCVMLLLWLRGREERQAKINEEVAKSLREDQREIFERQSSEIDDLKADKTALEARLHAREAVLGYWRAQVFLLYAMARDNGHAAAGARQMLIAAGIKQPEDFEHFPISIPEVPRLDRDPG
ncbi:hypothetical protein HMPREF9946_02174 [Acetobacteraceae bacterium AT-5844]|nr:hypothetical protein HMPREF9946_02174 [Acetobacteraceae bacterium AT-5844]